MPHLSRFQRSKKTYDQVLAQLVQDLCVKGSKSLSKPVNVDPKATLLELEEIYRRLALQKFHDVFGYEFSENHTYPPDVAPESKVTELSSFYQLKDPSHPGTAQAQQKRPSPARQHKDKNDDETLNNEDSKDKKESLTIFPVPDKGMTLSEVKASLWDDVNFLPPWAKDKARAKLAAEAESALSSTNQTPFRSTFTETYDDPRCMYNKSIRADVLFVSVTGELVDGDVKAKYTALYYVGVYYSVVSDATLAKQSLWNAVCDGANSLLSDRIELSTPPTRSELEKVLAAYRARVFVQDHGVQFDSEPSDSIEFLGRNEHLFIFEDDITSGLEKEAEETVFTPLNIPEWVPAQKEILNVLNECINDTTYNHGDWRCVKFDRTYLHKQPQEPSVVVKATFVHCNIVSSHHPHVTYRCVYFAGLFYKVTGAKDTVYGDFIKAVYASARSLVPGGAIPSPESPTKEDLDTFLDSACDTLFEKKFGFAIDGTNTKPTDSVGDTLFTARGGFETDTANDTAESLVNAHIVKPFAFPQWTEEPTLLKEIRSDLVLKVQHALKVDPLSTVPNQWTIVELDRSYSYADSSRPALAGKVVLVYCNGSMSQASQNLTIKKTFFYFAGVYYDQEEAGW